MFEAFWRRRRIRKLEKQLRVALFRGGVGEVIRDLVATADSEAVPPLIRALVYQGPGSDSESRQAADALAQLAPASIEPLIHLLRTEHDSNRVRAIWALRQIPDPAVVNSLGQLLLDEMDASRDDYDGSDRYNLKRSAFFALSEIGSPEAVSLLVRIVEEESPLDRESAVEALGSIGHPSAVPTLLRALKEPQATGEARRPSGFLNKFAEALAGCGPQGVEALLDALESGDGRVRAAAATWLKLLASTEEADATTIDAVRADRVRRAMIGAIRDPEWDVRSDAARYLTHKTIDWRPETEEDRAHLAIASENWTDLKALGKSAIRPLIATLEQFLRDEGSRLGPIDQVVATFGEVGGYPQSTDLMYRLLGHSFAAAEIIRLVDRYQDPRSVGPLIECARRDEENAAKCIETAEGILEAHAAEVPVEVLESLEGLSGVNQRLHTEGIEGWTDGGHSYLASVDCSDLHRLAGEELGRRASTP